MSIRYIKTKQLVKTNRKNIQEEKKMLEKYLIEHCSPTLASIKTANLFSISNVKFSDLKRHIHDWNIKLNDKGIVLISLKQAEDRALVYVCRKKQLQEYLNEPNVASFMKKYGYESIDADYAIAELKKRLAKRKDFPHEIGIFLGYPLGDVIGFIENAGKNSKCAGCWKVYCNECQAIKRFAQFEKCRNIYRQLWQNGKNVLQLTVAA